jgi:hypothetical protein
MEREVQWAKSQVQYARRSPFAYLANKATRQEQVKQIGFRFGLQKEFESLHDIPTGSVGGRGPRRELQKGLCMFSDRLACSTLTVYYRCRLLPEIASQ